MKVLITGVSSGLGLALATRLISQNHEVWGLSRRDPELAGLNFRKCDLSQFSEIAPVLKNELAEVSAWDRVYLNAGIIGRLTPMIDAQIDDMKTVMDVNLWANKIVLDEILKKPVRQVIATSSGASVNGSKGWSSYSLSKAALNMLMQLYASEFPETHFTSLAPGLVLTNMLNGLLENEPVDQFPSMQRLHDSEKMTPEQAAERIDSLNEKVLAGPSGQYADVRKM